MKINELCTTGCVSAIKEILEAETTKLRELAQENDVPSQCELNGQEVRDELIVYCIEQAIKREGHDPRQEHCIDWFGVDYQGAAELSGLEPHERLNTFSTFTGDNKDVEYLEPERDPPEEWDEIDIDLNWYKAPIEQDRLIKLIRLQIKMEETMVRIKSFDPPHQELRDTYRRVLDRHMKKKCVRDKQWYRTKDKLQAYNAWCREVCKKEARKNPVVEDLWNEGWALKERCDQVRGFDRRYIGIISGIAPFVPGKRPALPEDHVMLWSGKIIHKKDLRTNSYMRFLPPAHSVAELRKIRDQRIQWLKETLADKEWLERQSLRDPLDPNWVIRDDDTSRTYDSYHEHSVSLNRGEDLRDQHLLEEAHREYYKPIDLWKNKRKWVESYYDWYENQIATYLAKKEEQQQK